jgi:hypothetical protein
MKKIKIFIFIILSSLFLNAQLLMSYDEIITELGYPIESGLTKDSIFYLKYNKNTKGLIGHRSEEVFLYFHYVNNEKICYMWIAERSSNNLKFTSTFYEKKFDEIGFMTWYDPITDFFYEIILGYDNFLIVSWLSDIYNLR